MPNIVINWSAIAVACLAAFIFGGIWYTPLFGATWAKLMGMDMTKKPEKGVMVRAFTLQIIGIFLTTYVMAHTVQVWQPSVWNAGPDMPKSMNGFYGGLFTWVGFYVPMQFGKVGWEGKPWKLFFINAGHDFINLQIIAQILAHWR